MTQQSISIIGCGNVGSNLGLALYENGIRINHVLSANHQSSEILAVKTNSISASGIHEISPDDLLLICVPDDEIANVINSVSDDQRIAYTSGSVELNSFKDNNNIGVFYPLQTFTKNRNVDLKEVPFLIESEDKDFGDALFSLAKKISDKVQYSNSEERKRMHVAAVMVNNFTNHIIHNAQQYSEQQNIKFDVFVPLLKETISKLDDYSAYDAQTGPARRNDLSVIESHLEMLNEEQAKIYRVLTESIQLIYKEGGKL
jgi:predicted short-subunit dehydrogenase-like oxidoreductase (DUF2520 family)